MASGQAGGKSTWQHSQRGRSWGMVAVFCNVEAAQGHGKGRLKFLCVLGLWPLRLLRKPLLFLIFFLPE